MSYNVAALGSYTKQDANSLIYKTIATGNTAALMSKQPGIKSAETINIVATHGVWQAGGTCGFNASGDSTFSQRTLTVGRIKVQLKWCEKDLEPKYLQGALAAGSTYNMLTFEQEIVGDIQQNMMADVENAIWKGDLTAGSVYLNKFDGILTILAAAGTYQTATPVAWSVANSRTAVQNAIAATTVDILANTNIVMFMGIVEHRDYVAKLGIDNLYHISGSEGVTYAENSNIKIIPTLGLSGTKKIVIADPKNFVLGFDMLNEDEKFDLFYAKEADEIRFNSEFKLGVQVAFPDQVVLQSNT